MSPRIKHPGPINFIWYVGEEYVEMYLYFPIHLQAYLRTIRISTLRSRLPLIHALFLMGCTDSQRGKDKGKVHPRTGHYVPNRE